MRDITVYGAGANGGHAVSVDVDGLRVLVTPPDDSRDRDAVALAQGVRAVHELHQRVYRAERTAEAAKAAERCAVAALEHAMTGNRRLFGRALLMPELAGDWGGAVWLYDPDKREAGMGLRFPSLAAVRATYPELWVVGVLDGGVLLDAVSIPAPKEASNA